MAQTIKRKDFLVLTVTFGTLGVATACGDDADTNFDGVAGKGGGGASSGGAGGSNVAGNGVAGSSAGTPGGGAPGGGSGGSANHAGTAGRGGAGGSAGSAGSEHAGQGGGGAGGEGTAGAAGEAGAGGTGGAGGVNAGGEPGVSGAGGGGGAGGAGPTSCAGVVMSQTATTGNGHTHITNDGQNILTFLINGSNPTAPFQLPQAGTGHSHTIQLTQDEIDKLLAGLPVTGKVSSLNGHTHTYTISCG